jgi:hypothetical protein
MVQVIVHGGAGHVGVVLGNGAHHGAMLAHCLLPSGFALEVAA